MHTEVKRWVTEGRGCAVTTERVTRTRHCWRKVESRDSGTKKVSRKLSNEKPFENELMH